MSAPFYRIKLYIHGTTNQHLELSPLRNSELAIKVSEDSSSDHDGMLDLDDFAEAVEYLIAIFHIPLEAKGMCVASIQDEVVDVVSYARNRFRELSQNLVQTSHQSNIFMLCELLYSLPISSSRVE